MADVSTIEVKLNGATPALIVDGDLALSRWGLLLAARLAETGPLWVPRSLWPLIDSDRLYREEPGLLGRGGEEAAEALSDWHAAWQCNRLKGAFHWFGDHRHESQLPDEADEFLLQRFEAALNQLIGRLGGESEEAPLDWRDQSICDALATAAALSPRPSVLIARRSSVFRLAAIAKAAPQFSVGEVKKPPPALGERLNLSLLPPLLLGELDLIAIHLAAPKAMLLPWGSGDADMWGEADPGFAPPGGGAPDPFTGATIAWHGV